MLWTLFKLLIAVWMLQLLLRFGGSAVQAVLAVSLAVMLLRLAVRHSSERAGGWRDFRKTGSVSAHDGGPWR
jgi:hypothetical protein